MITLEELDLTQEEVDDCLMFAIEDLPKIAVRGQISMMGLHNLLKKYNIEKVSGIIEIAIERAKAAGFSIVDSLKSGTSREAGTR